MEHNPENPTEDLGGLVIPASAGAGSDSTVQNASASEGEIRKRKQRSDVGKPRKSSAGTNAASVPPLSQSQFAALYDPKLWSRCLSAPADGMAAITGKKHWEISEEEKQALGATGAVAAQCFAVTDPRWLAASLALITIMNVYGTRVAIELADRKREREAKERAKRDLHASTDKSAAINPGPAHGG